MSQTNGYTYTDGDGAPSGSTSQSTSGGTGAGGGAGGYRNAHTNGVSAASPPGYRTPGYQIDPDTSRSPREFNMHGNVRPGSYGNGSVIFDMRSAQEVPHLQTITLAGLDESGARNALGGWTDGMLVQFIIHGVTHEPKRIQVPRH